MNTAQQIGLALARASAEAYKANASAELVIRERSTDTVAVVGASESDVIVAFRGTADLRNWLTDARFGRERYAFFHDHDCRIHAGFLDGWLSVVDDLRDALLDHRRKRLWLTGHSLGGALAMLAAAELWEANNVPEIAGVWTFGQPRVGNGVFASAYDFRLRERTWRFVHANDVVPRVPWLCGLYQHAGREVFYPMPATDGKAPAQRRATSGGGPLIDAPWWKKLPYDARGLWRKHCLDVDALIADHHVSHYVKLFSGEVSFTEGNEGNEETKLHQNENAGGRAGRPEPGESLNPSAPFAEDEKAAGKRGPLDCRTASSRNFPVN